VYQNRACVFPFSSLPLCCSMWYAYELGAYAAAGVGLVSRQTLVGGSYELIDDAAVIPYPDYYVSLLWKRLIGSQVWCSSLSRCGSVLAGRHLFLPPLLAFLQVLSASLSPSSPDSPVRAFAHCAYGDGRGSAGAGVVAILVNFALNETVPVSIAWGGAGSAATVEVYQLQPLAGPKPGTETGGGGRSASGLGARPTDWYGVALNGQPLEFRSGGPVPATPPLVVPVTEAVALAPTTVTLVVNAGAGAGVCSGR
jgi:hypothetical protein